MLFFSEVSEVTLITAAHSTDMTGTKEIVDSVAKAPSILMDVIFIIGGAVVYGMLLAFSPLGEFLSGFEFGMELSFLVALGLAGVSQMLKLPSVVARLFVGAAVATSTFIVEKYARMAGFEFTLSSVLPGRTQ